MVKTEGYSVARRPMSRIGKQAIALPDEVKIEIKSGQIKVGGPRGALILDLPKELKTEQHDNKLYVSYKGTRASAKRALWGLYRSLINNAVIGVTQGFTKKLEMIGIGYRGTKKGEGLELEVGYSHTVFFKPPSEVKVDIEKNVITVSGTDRQKVGQAAAEIRAIKPPEPYKGKGIRYQDEEVVLKPGKAAKVATVGQA